MDREDCDVIIPYTHQAEGRTPSNTICIYKSSCNISYQNADSCLRNLLLPIRQFAFQQSHESLLPVLFARNGLPFY